MSTIFQFRPVLAVVFLLLFIASCKPAYRLGRQPAAVPPFVQLKDGTVIAAKEVGQESDFDKSRIVADEQVFPRNKVALYSNGEQTFANLGHGKFGPKTAEGKIMVYAATNAAHYGYAYHDYLHPYIQDSGSSQLFYLRYRALKRMIPTGTAGYTMLTGAKNARTALRLTMLGGFACFVGGTLLASKGVMKDNGDSQINTGLTLIYGGMGITATSTVSVFIYKMKMRRAIAIHNGVLSPN